MGPVTTDKLNELSEEFDALCLERLAQGAQEYGPTAFLKNDMLVYIAEELADVANYARMTYMKIRIMMEAVGATGIDQPGKTSGVQHDDDVPLGASAFTASSEIR